MCKKLIYLTSFVLVLGLVLTSRADAADPSLVGWWRFDEGSGTIASDSSSYGNDGTLGGNAAWDEGLYGGSLYVDGASGAGWVDIDPVSWAPIERQVTVAFWAFGDEALPANCFMFGAWSADINMDREASAAPWGDSNMYWDAGYDSTATAYDRISKAIPEEQLKGEWVHWAFTKDCDTGEMHIYLNGELWHSGTGMTRPMTGVIQFSIGVRAMSDHTQGYIGWFDDFRLYDRALTEAEIQQAMLGVPPELASDPSPANEATDVPREVVLSWEPGQFAAPTNGHKIYFGESFNDVNDATDAVAQTAASYTPAQRLDFGTTYYWRVDEVNAPPTSHIEFKSEVWQFTTEPIAYAIENITATASSSNSAEEGPENTINSSGLDADDLHSAKSTAMWLSSATGPQPTWIQYEFDSVYKLHQMWVWNHNSLLEAAIGFGVKDVTIEYSVDGNDYTTLGATHEFARGSGAVGYAYNTTVDLGGAAAKYVRLTTNSNWGGILPQYGLSEVQFFSIPVQAREPSPGSEATDVDVDVTLGFRAGREAVTHDVYLSSDEQAVIDGNAPVTPVTETSYGPLSLDLGTTYYWKVNEVNEAETTTMLEGDIWNFTTQEYLVVDDFELYNDLNPDDPDSNRIFLTWIDGYDNPAINGSLVGYAEAPFAEQSIVYGGKQSMPLYYDNSTAGYSEATANVADLQVGQDWTRHGIKALTLRFFGDPNNAVQQMYVKLNGSKVTYDGDAENIRRTAWQMWYIDLASLGVSLSNVTELSIGFERSGAVGGQGVVYFDGIRLYSHDRQFITPAEPNTAGLVGHYELDGNANDSSGNNNHGTLAGDPQWVAGHIGSGALGVNGRHDYVDLGDPTSLQITGNITLAAWIKTDAPEDDYDNILAKGYTTGPDGGIFLRVFNGNYDTGSWDASGNHLASVGGASADIGQWVHLAGTYDGSNWNLYKNGQLVGSTADSVGAVEVNAGWAIGSRGGGIAERLFGGLIDDARIYDRALSYGEIAGLAGRTLPFDKPF